MDHSSINPITEDSLEFGNEMYELLVNWAAMTMNERTQSVVENIQLVDSNILNPKADSQTFPLHTINCF